MPPPVEPGAGAGAATGISPPRPPGLLTYTTGNLGDDVRSIAALRFLGGASALLDRDDLAGMQPPASAAIILNGWWMHRPGRVSGAGCDLDPLLTSMHLTPLARSVLENRGVRAFLLRHGPVGCRDLATLAILEEAGIPARFTGCLTLTLRRTPGLPPARVPYLLVVDCPASLAAWIPAHAPLPIRMVAQRVTPTAAPLRRLELARAHLGLIERAAAVVTSRLHTALPALALGVPVLFVPPKANDPRFPGLGSLLHAAPPEDAPRALAERFAGGWPENPPDFRPLAAALERETTDWVASRPAPPAGPPPLVTWDGLAAGLLANPGFAR